jgi:hypothetical protein
MGASDLNLSCPATEEMLESAKGGEGRDRKRTHEDAPVSQINSFNRLRSIVTVVDRKLAPTVGLHCPENRPWAY